MSDIKWIKITTDIFDDEKILLIESMPDADAIIVIWFKLLCLAGKQNNSGVFLMNGRIPYTDEMLATIFRRKPSTVKLALSTFQTFGMVEIIDGTITIPNWGKHQSIDKIEAKTQYQREYMREYRRKQKALIGVSKYNEAGLDPEDWKEVLTEFNYECAYCGCKEGLEQEHIIPVTKGGAFVIGNIIPACRNCNGSKGNKDLWEWYRGQEFWDLERYEKIRKYSRKYLRKANVSSLDKNREDKKEIREEEKEEETSPVLPPYIMKIICHEKGASESLTAKIVEWCEYRIENYGDEFLPKRFNSIVSNVLAKAKKHGEDAVIDQIGTSIREHWKGMNLDKLEKKEGKRSGGRFNQMETHDYDFEALEKVLTGGNDGQI